MERYNFTNPLFLSKIEYMIRRFFILFCFAFLFACDDGDIINVTLEFDKELERCDDFEDVYLLYDTREDPNESLTLLLPKATYEFLFTTATLPDTPEQFNIGSGVQFNYRIYNKVLEGDVLCDVLSDPDLVVLEDYEADSATMVEVEVFIEDDDNDGIPSADEYGPGGLENPQDSDADGIADYLDEDDDNDNVSTSIEIDGGTDGNPITSPMDTDSDGVPDYLDTDDDGDGVLTREEDEDEDKVLTNDFQESTDGTTVPPRYLDNTATEAFPFPGLTDDNLYTRSVRTTFTVFNVSLGPISGTVIDFGTYESSFTIDE